jgi:putative heme-binding domain-containing protein
LEKQIAKLAGSPAIQSLLVAVLNDGSDAGRLVALHAMASAGVKSAPTTWLDAIVALLPKAGAGVLPDCVATARALPLPKDGHKAFATALAQTGRRDDVPAQVRLDALTVARTPGSVEPALFDFLLRQIAIDQPLLARTAAANVLAKANLGANQQFALADALRTAGPLEAPKLLPAFERNPTEAIGLRLVSALKDSAGLRGLRADLLKPLFARYPRPVQEAGQSLIRTLNADAEKQAAHLDDLVAHLPAGDLRRGQAVFIRGGCQVCHTIGYQGGRLGPDITNIGKVRTPRDLIEAIVYPSASIVRGYETFTVSTRSGEMYAGTVARDAGDEVVLNIAPLVQQRIARADIARMIPIPISLMPLGFGDLLPRQDLSDLVEFLRASQR